MSLQLIAPDGQALDLLPKTQIQINLVNSIFNPEVMEGSFTYSFEIPASPTNLLYFRFKNRISASADRTIELPGFTIRCGIISIPVSVVLLSSSDRGFKINLLATSGILASTLKQTKLKDVPMDTIIEPVTFGMYIHAYMGFFDGDPDEGDEIRTVLVYNDLPDLPQNNIVFIVKFRTDGPTTIQDLVNGINTPVYPNPFSLGTGYLEHDVVIDINSNYWEAFEDNTGFPLVDESEGGKWTFIGGKSAWHTYRFSTYTQGWRYADPYHDGRIMAEATEGDIPFNNSFIVRDIRTSTPDLMVLTGSFDNIGTNYGFDIYDSNIDVEAFYEQYASMLNDHFKAQNELAATDELATHVFPVIKNDKFTSNEDYFGYVNYYVSGAFTFNTGVTGNRYKYAISPQVYVKYVFAKIFDYLNLDFNTDFFSNTNNASKVLYSNFILNQVSAIYSELGGYVYFDAFSNKYNLAQCMPLGTIADFINAVRTFLYWGVFFDYKRSAVILKTLEDVLTDTPVDWTGIIGEINTIDYISTDGYYISYRDSSRDAYRSELTEPDLLAPGKFNIKDPVANQFELPVDEPDLGAVRYSQDIDKWFVFTRVDDGSIGWEFLSENSIGYKTGNGDMKIQVLADCPLIFRGARPTGANWEVPIVREESFSIYNYKSDPTSLRLMNYLGLKPDSEDETYPMATTGINTYDGSATAVTTATRFEKADGLALTIGEKWIDFISKTQPVQIPVALDEFLFSKIDFTKPIRVGSQTYLIRKVTLQLPFNSGASTFTLCPIR